MRKLSPIFILLFASSALAAQEVAAPAKPWAVRMADSVLARQPKATMIEQRNPTDAFKWSYSAAFLVRAVGEVGVRTGDKKYLDYAKDYVDAFVSPAGVIDPKKYNPAEFQLDHIAPGRTVMLVWNQAHEERYRKAIEELAGQFKEQPRTASGGFWHKKVYPNQMWLDGIFMGCPFMANYGKMVGGAEAAPWYDEAARQIILIGEHTQDAKTGLCYHAWDESKKEKWADAATGLSANFWGRADGWYAMGMVETLDALPADHPARKQIMAILDKLAAGIIKVQDPASGVWWQVMDQGTREGNYLESSASGMFVYALARAAHENYLTGETKTAALAAARKGFDGMVKTFVDVNATGQVTLKDTCAVAGLGGTLIAMGRMRIICASRG